MNPEEALARLERIEQTYLQGDAVAALELARVLVEAIEKSIEATGGQAEAVEAWTLGYAHRLAGQCLNSLGDAAGAAFALQRAQLLLELIGDASGVADCIHSRGQLAQHVGETAEARRLFEDAGSRYEALPNPLGVAHCIFSLGELAQQAGETAEARRLYEDACARYENLRDMRALGTCLHSLGELGRQAGETTEARRLFEDARARCEAASDPLGVAHCIRSLGHLARQAGETAEARRLFEDARARYEAASDPLGVAHCIHSLGELAQQVGITTEARRLFEDARTRYEALHDPWGAAHCIRSLGQLAQQVGNTAESRRLFEDARTRYEVLPDPWGVAHCVRSMGELEQQAGETTEAGRLFEDARSRYEALPDPVGVAHCIRNLGELAQEAGERDRSRRLLEDARARYEALPDPLGVAHCIRSLGELAQQAGETAEARRLFEDAGTRYEALPNPLGVAHCVRSLGELSQQAGETAEARRLFEKAEASYRAVGDPMEAWCLALRSSLSPEPAERLLLAQRAVEVVERVRMSLDAVYARQQHSLNWQEVYLEAMRSARVVGEYDEALRFATLLAGRLLHERELSEGIDPRSLLVGDEAATFEGLTNAVAQAERLLATLTVDTPERGEALKQLQWTRSEKRRLHEQAELRVRLEPPRSVDIAALKAELRRRDATLVFLLWQPEMYTALVVHPNGSIEFVDYGGVPADVDAGNLTPVQLVDAVFNALHTETNQPIASGDFFWRSRVVRPLRRLLWEPLQQIAGDGPLYLIPDPALAQAPVRSWSRNIALLPTPGALLAGPSLPTVPRSIFAVGGDVAGGLRGPEVDLALVRSQHGMTGVGDQLQALFEQDGSFELALVTGHMGRAGIALPRTVVSADTGELAEISVTVTLRELMGLRLRLRWGVLAGCLSGASDGSPDLLSVGGVFMQVTGAEAVVAALWPVRDLPATLVWAGLLHHTRQGLELEPALEATLEELRALRTALEWADYLDVLRVRHPDVPALVEFVLAYMAGNVERLAVPQVDLDAWALFRR